MASDRARDTYDETKQYRRVVPQQGRVILEADLNEASTIATEDVRHEVLDVVGPAGVPSDPVSDADGTGYLITPAATEDFAIGPGVIYVGGWRVVQPDPKLRDTTQLDWLDRPAASPGRGIELAALRLREQEVSAVEDATLREVALGGPDTAQRVRLIRRVERFAVQTAACSAWSEVVAGLAKLGQVFDPRDMSLAPTARLAVSKETLGVPAGPCDPAASDGYLGAENQMIRVQLASASELVWSYDDGSALYRIDLDTADTTGKTLVLRQVPVDAFHQPRTGQHVEVLRAAADLGSGAYAAATTGFVTTLASAYQPDGGKLVLTGALPAEYRDAAQTPALFLRVWENRAAFTAGTAQPLVDQAGNHTGLQVTLTSGPFVAGSFWCFAVRPTTPAELYPARYASPQPPEGPREWLCPLAVIDWTQDKPVATDCRPTFDNLVTLTEEVDKLAARDRNTGCCTVTVGPEDLTEKRTLQAIVDRYQAALRIGTRVTICLKPGVYELRKPLRLGKDHSGIAIEGCHGGAVIRAAAGTEHAFLDGLIVLVHANEVALRGLRFHLPQVPFAKSGGRLGDLPYARIGSEGSELQQLAASIAIRPVHSAELTVEGCLFRYSLTAGHHVFGAGIFAGSECWGFHILDNQFVMEEDYLRNEDALTRLLFGCVLAPTVTVALKQADPAEPLSRSITGGTFARALLTAAELRGNLFSGLVAAALLICDGGTIRLEDNRVRDSYGGFWLLSSASFMPQSTVDPAHMVSTPPGNTPDVFAVFSDPPVLTGAFLAIGYPLPAGLDPDELQQVTIGGNAKLLGARARARADGDEAAADGEAAAVSEELALAIRFAAEPKAKLLTLHDTIAPALDLVLISALLADKRHTQSLALHIVDNDVDVRTQGIASGAALAVWDLERKPQGAVMVSANRIASASLAQATVIIARTRRIVITGNLLINDTLELGSDPELRMLLAQLGARGRKAIAGKAIERVADLVNERWCLVAFPSSTASNPPVAITGNVCEGFIALPVRPEALPPWSTLNTQV